MSEGLLLTEKAGGASPAPGRVGTGDFTTRHRLLLVILWLQVPALAGLGLARGAVLHQVVAASLLLILLAAAGMIPKNRSLAASLVALGLVAAAGTLVLYMNGSTESLFAFFLAITAISLYKDWKPLLVGLAALAALHLIAGFFVPGQALARSPAAADPAWWASAHFGATLLLALLLATSWRLPARWDAAAASPEEGFRHGFETAPIGMAVLTPSGEFLRANQAVTQILGYEERSLIGANIDRVIHSDDLGDLGKAWEEVSRTHLATAWLRCVTSKGVPIWGRLSLSLVPWAPDQPAMVLLHIEDATRAYHDQTRLERLIEEKDRFVAAVGGEIRQPLDSILELASYAGGEHVDLDRIVTGIEAHANQAAAIVDDLVVSARADSMPITVVPGPVDAGKLCRDVLRGFPGSERFPVGIGATELWADPGLTKRIVRTLLDNAVRYGGPYVEVVTLTSGPDTVIQVIDDGPEIPVSERERIFNGDLRSGQLVTSPASVGLSLTVARHLARQMDGDLAYRRTQDDQNVFELRLPSEQLTPARHVRRIEAEPLGISA